MLQVNGSIINVDDYCTTREYDGEEYLDFSINSSDPAYKQITERAVICSESNNYLVTKIDGNSGQYVHVSAEVDRHDFQSVFYENYDNGSKTLTQAVNAFLPSGWTFVNNGNTTSYRTLRLEYGTALDLLDNCAALYKVRFSFNAQTKTLTAVNPEAYSQSAAFVTEELNLKSLQYYGDASGFITRLEARGKDGITFVGAEIDGQIITTSYVEDYSYSTDIVYGYWKDERYTVKADLYQAAKEKLAEMAHPVRSYECSVIDLKSIDPERYTAFDLSLYQRVALKDVSRETSHVYQVVKVVNYPHYPEKNVVTLSTSAPKLTTKLQDIETEVKELDSAVEANNTSWLTDSEGGYIYFIRDNDGNITSFVLKVGEGENPPVWVFNKNGIGYSADGISGVPIIAMKADGEIVAISGSVGGWHIGDNALWAGDASNPLAVMWSQNGMFQMGNMILYGNLNDSSLTCPYIQTTASNGDLMLMMGTATTSGCAFSAQGRVTSKLYPDFDGNGHSKLQVNFVELSADGLRALKSALAGV